MGNRGTNLDMNDDIALEMRSISKHYAGVKALNDVSIRVHKAKVNVLVGENGAGKSTLMKILAGATIRDSGEIILDGNPIDLGSPEASINAGIAMIYQELNLVQDMTVAENMALGTTMKQGLIFDRKKTDLAAREILQRYGMDIDPSLEMRELSIAKQQLVEIAKALSRNAKIIVMDEPTSSLSIPEVDRLLSLVEMLRRQGVTIVYISHRMQEIFQIGDYATVLCDGRTVGEWDMSELDEAKLIAHMVGREIKHLYPKQSVPIGETVLEVRNLTVKGTFDDISFNVRRGEILGIAGLVGAGRTEICLSIFGALSLDAGSISVNGRDIKIRCPMDAMKNRIAYVPEDRKALGVNLTASIQNNIGITNEDKISLHGIIRRSAEQSLVGRMIEKLGIKCFSGEQAVSDLSGGNQQKVVLAKWIARDIDVLILDEPTRGVDIGAKEEIYRLIIEFAKQGLAIIIVSSELPEVLGMSDRIVVIHEGKLTGSLEASTATQESVMSYAAGVEAD